MANIYFDCEDCGPMNEALFNLQEYDKSRLYEQCFVKCSILNHLDINIRLIDLKEATKHVQNLDYKLFWSKLTSFLNSNKKETYLTCDNCHNDVLIYCYCENCGESTWNTDTYLCDPCKEIKT